MVLYHMPNYDCLSTRKNKSQAVSNGVFKEQHVSRPTFQLVDKRPFTVEQRRLQLMAEHSPQSKQVAQLQKMMGSSSTQEHQPIQKKNNNTGLPDSLKTGIERFSGYAMDDVKVHYNSNKPAQLQAHAYAQGTEIHLGPGQEKHLPHEAWHVAQQKQGRVKPTVQMKGKVNINDEASLEKEADVMGKKVAQQKGNHISNLLTNTGKTPNDIIQGYFYWGNAKIDSKEQVERFFSEASVSSSKLKASQKKAIIAQRMQALMDAALSENDEGKAVDKEGLISLITKFDTGRKLLEKGMAAGPAAAGAKVSASEMQKTQDTSMLGERLSTLVQSLLQTKRIFPSDHVYTTAKKALGEHGSGFFVELTLALKILTSKPKVKVQLGVVGHTAILGYLGPGFSLEESKSRIKGLVGGDLTIWEPTEQQPAKKHTFIQSKTATDRTLDENVIAAANQLASLTASGNPAGKSAEREYTMTGPSFEGAIFVMFTGEASTSKFNKIGATALSRHPEFVHKIVFECMDGSFYVFTRDGGSYQKTNPLSDGEYKSAQAQTAAMPAAAQAPAVPLMALPPISKKELEILYPDAKAGGQPFSIWGH